MAEEIKPILNIDTTTAVSSLRELAGAVTEAKDRVKDLAKEGKQGTGEYQQALAELKSAQGKYNETLSFTAKGIKEADGSFNALNARLGELKKAWRETGDEAERARLTVEVNKVKEQINSLNESIGNYQHNVGNYFNSTKAALEAFKNGLMTASPAVEGLSKGLSGLAANPVLGTIGILVTSLTSLVGRMKESEEGAESLNKLMAVGKQLMQPIEKLISWLVQKLTVVADWVATQAPQILTFMQGVVANATGVGNALVQYLLTPIRTIVSAAKGLGKILKDIFTGEFGSIGEDAKAAGEEIGEAWKRGFSFKTNFEGGRAAGEEWITGLMSKREDAEKAGEAVGAAAAAGITNGLADAEKALAAAEKAAQERRRMADAWEKSTKENMAEWQKELDAEVDAESQMYFEAELARIQAIVDAEKEAQEEKERIEKAKQAMMKSSLAVTKGILNSLADVMEANSDGTVEQANKVKAVRIASSTIDTITGALGAFMQAQSTYPPPYGQIIGAITAAGVTAAGIAQIAKIKSTDVAGGGSGASAAASPISVTPPALQADIPVTANITGASDEARLNERVADQKVYILSSDLEANGRRVGIQNTETSF